MYSSHLSRYVSVTYDLRCLTIAFFPLLSYLYGDSDCSGINDSQLVANTIIFKIRNNPRNKKASKMMRFLLPVTGKLLVVRRCLLADAEAGEDGGEDVGGGDGAGDFAEVVEGFAYVLRDEVA